MTIHSSADLHSVRKISTLKTLYTDHISGVNRQVPSELPRGFGIEIQPPKLYRSALVRVVCLGMIRNLATPLTILLIPPRARPYNP